jgi:hypothetical protein
MDQPIYFSFQSSNFTGFGNPIQIQPNHEYPHVLRLQLRDNPNHSLPHNIILKLEDDPDNQGFFNTELSCYNKMEALQGIYIPTLLGITSVNGIRALILSDIGGVSMIDERMPYLEESFLRANLRKPLEEIRRSGVYHEDLSLHNIHYIAGKFMVVDFEHGRINQSTEQVLMEEDVDRQINEMVTNYQRRQKGIRSIALIWSRASGQATLSCE